MALRLKCYNENSDFQPDFRKVSYIECELKTYEGVAMSIKLLTGITLGLAMISSSAFAANTILEEPYSSHVINNSKFNSSYGTNDSEMHSASNQVVDTGLNRNKMAPIFGWDADSSN